MFFSILFEQGFCCTTLLECTSMKWEAYASMVLSPPISLKKRLCMSRMAISHEWTRKRLYDSFHFFYEMASSLHADSWDYHFWYVLFIIYWSFIKNDLHEPCFYGTQPPPKKNAFPLTTLLFALCLCIHVFPVSTFEKWGSAKVRVLAENCWIFGFHFCNVITCPLNRAKWLAHLCSKCFRLWNEMFGRQCFSKQICARSFS